MAHYKEPYSDYADVSNDIDMYCFAMDMEDGGAEGFLSGPESLSSPLESLAVGAGLF
jgi:hypothetical protein